MSLNLKSVVSTHDLSREFEYPGISGFFVTLGYVGKSKLREIGRRSTVIRFKNHKEIPDIDDEKMTKYTTQAAILGWRGLTVKGVKQLIVLDINGVPGETIEEKEQYPVDFTEENAELLLRESMHFDEWVSNIIMDLSRFQDIKIEETVGNLNGSSPASKDEEPSSETADFH